MEAASLTDPSIKKKAETLQSLTSPLTKSVSKLSGSSRCMPSEKDFHFYYNFDEFKIPVKEIAEKSETMLKSMGSSSGVLFGKPLLFPNDPDDSYDWLVNVNDEFLERVDVSMDEFQRLRKKEESGKGVSSMESDGFQLVYGKKKKGSVLRNVERSEEHDSIPLTTAKIASKDQKVSAGRSKVPFHIPSIPRPQDEFSILVNNLNQPFEHVWLQRTEDGSRFLHPLENISVLDFVDKSAVDVEPVKPLPLGSTPFKLVEDVKELKQLAAKLQGVNEFAVDLEHNQYRSFQGLTCLMQISTRTEDFLVDTLKLRVHVGPYLREVFKDPSKRKVMHGADRDICWLQRDFGIYVCNMFDTGQGSRVLQLDRNSLEYLLHHFCGVTANKEYQNADWRLRPLPDEMIKYAREDTHYLLHIYDLMRGRLLLASAESENGDDLLLEVYNRSYGICMQLYEKELFTDTSYLHVYGLQGADFNSQQLAVVAGLCKWRDVVARAEDESTGYILPNKALLEIAKQMPVTPGMLRRLVNLKHPFVERNLGSVVSIIRSSIKNATAFESACEQLKKGREATAPEGNIEADTENASDVTAFEDCTIIKNVSSQAQNDDDAHNTTNGQMDEDMKMSRNMEEESLKPVESRTVECCSSLLSISSETTHSFPPGSTVNGNSDTGAVKSAAVASVQMLKKPSRAFGALLGNSTSKRKLNVDPKESSFKQDRAEIKLEQIKSTVSLPFHSFSGQNEQLKILADESIKSVTLPETILGDGEPAKIAKLEEVIPLEKDTDDPESSAGVAVAEDGTRHREWFPPQPEHDNAGGSGSESETDNEPLSLADLSSSFQKCFRSINEVKNSENMERRSSQPGNFKQMERSSKSGNSKQLERSLESDYQIEFKPFDYAAARKQMKFGDGHEEQEGKPVNDGKTKLDSRDKQKGSDQIHTGSPDFRQPRRRQAFPASGNRSATYR